MELISIQLSNKSKFLTALIWAVFFIPILWLFLLAASIYSSGQSLFSLLNLLIDKLNNPLIFSLNNHSLRFSLIAAIVYGFVISSYYTLRGNYRYGEEHGSAYWGNVKEVCKRYEDKKNPQKNLILTQNFKMSTDTRKHQRCLNILCVGGSGSGKSRYFARPNILQCGHSSFFIADPKGEALRTTGNLLKAKGYEIKVLNLIDMSKSDCYNPFAYIQTDEDVFKLITNLIRNTTPHKANANDPFWEKSETALLSALCLFLYHEADFSEQNFSTVMFLIENGGASEEDEGFLSPLDLLFSDLEEAHPEHIAVKEYKVFKQAAGKTAKSILVSAAVRLAVFNLPKLQAITDTDNLDIGSLGEKKKAIFAVLPDNDDTFGFIIGTLYTSAIQTLYRKADFEYGGSLPVPVHIIMDEFSNVANLSPDDFLRALNTMRSRQISVSIITQALGLLKKQFGNDVWESVLGGCDLILYLNGNEAGSHEYFSKMLGKSTIDTKTHGQTKGRQGSSSQNFQNTGRELLTPDEIRRMDNKNALLFIRGEPPIIDRKYDLMKHPYIKLTEDGGAPPYVHQTAATEITEAAVLFDLSRIDTYQFI